jgi:predicted nucleotidyltransferase
MSNKNIVADRLNYSQGKLELLASQLKSLQEVKAIEDLTIYCAGSFGRLEASKFSDIDLFFILDREREDLKTPRTKELRLFGKVISTVGSLGFPELSNDCEYLVLLPMPDILKHLGGRLDDHQNYFTARMLLLLESRPLTGEPTYERVLQSVIESYFKDYPDHAHTFQPVFLLNDICRFWKTMLLNYENKRGLNVSGSDDAVLEKKIKHKVKNFKLKFSRLTTCLASIAALGYRTAPVKPEDVLEIARLTPRERLERVAGEGGEVQKAVARVLEEYAWFLEMTGTSTAILESHFADAAQRKRMFDRANTYGDAMFELIRLIDARDSSLRLLRSLVV